MMGLMYYTGVGSRSTPTSVRRQMTDLAEWLEGAGYVLRTGDAEGADAAFAEGAQQKRVYSAKHWLHSDSPPNDDPIWAMAYEIARTHHPAWHRCSQFARRLHARNCFQVLGPHLDETSEFVLCWTPGGRGSGGTGQAIRLAESRCIPVYDLGDPENQDPMRWIAEHFLIDKP